MMRRSDAAKAWGSLLSELADVPVAVEWERPSWIVRWRDGPTRAALMTRAVALGAHRFGRPLLVEDLLFSRHDSAVALGWLATAGRPAGRLADGMAAVEEFCERIGYPEDRFDDRALGAADLLVRLSASDRYEMGRLLSRAVPGVPPIGPLPAGPDLRGRTGHRWSQGGPPVELLGPPEPPDASALSTASAPDGADEDQHHLLACAHCGRPLTSSRGAGPAREVLQRDLCRTAAHRAHRAGG